MDRHDTLLLGGGTPESRRITRSNLGGNYHLLEAGNTGQTLLLLEQNRGCIAAVLLDLTAPDQMDPDMLLGPEGTRLLDRIPVIVITGDDSQEILDRYFALGAADVIPLHYEPSAPAEPAADGPGTGPGPAPVQ